MGSCSSCQRSVPSAKLIMEDGGVEEFVKPIKVEQILSGRRRYFVCDSECMAVNEYLRLINPEHELQLNHLYFLLPITNLQHRLAASDMVALAMKAGAAMKRSGYKCRCKIVPFAEENVSGHGQPAFHRLLSRVQNLDHGQESPEASALHLTKSSISLPAESEKAKPTSSRQTSPRGAWTAMLSPIQESPVHNS